MIGKLLDALRALVYMTGFIFLWGWMAMGVRRYDPELGIALPAWTQTLGIPFMLIGGILVLLCAGAFVIWGRGTPAPFDAPREFVALGPYRCVRNPMYIGGGILLSGLGLYERSPSILLLSLLGLLLAHLFVVFYEEPTLRDRFGPTYVNYCARVARWIPRVPRSTVCT